MLQRIPPLLDAFVKEAEGVRIAEDIEYIHRMRVASRRLRAALPLFKPCFPSKQYGRWMAEIAGITRALGDARDADVQIAFLTKYEKKQLATWKKHKRDDGTEPPVAPAIRYLLSDIRKRRTLLQDRVISALDALEKSRVVPDLQKHLAMLDSQKRRIPRKGLSHGVPALAALRIETRLLTLLSYEPWVTHPDAVAEHHATRIAAKKLRYTMEIYGPVYRLGLAKPHARVKKMQDILGDLHDCDVWIDQITRVLLRERSRFRSANEEKRPDTKTLGSLRIFLLDREKERRLLHRQFMRYWESQFRAGTWDELRATLICRRKQLYIPAAEKSPDEIRATTGLIAARYPELLSHERHVTALALMLFDETTAVHGLADHDRLLLETAGMLHDIGWQRGRKKHHIRGAETIIADEMVPFDIGERAVIALIAFAHRGRNSPEQHPLFTILPSPLQATALRLAALLRLADGLDFQHKGTVREVHCSIDKETITCDAISQGDITVEKEHARTKSDLFVRVFKRELVIR